MSISTAELNNSIASTERQNYKQKADDTQFQPLPQLYLLQAVIESFVDGILILTERGELVHANERACQICSSLLQDATQPNALVQAIWRVRQSAIENHKLFPDQKIVIESEVETNDSATYRIRARWLNLGDERIFLLVTLEDKHHSTQNLAIADANRYGLTSREAEVWLLRRANNSYKEIAAKLYITLNTVKKHIKNIHLKQQAMQWAEE